MRETVDFGGHAFSIKFEGGSYTCSIDGEGLGSLRSLHDARIVMSAQLRSHGCAQSWAALIYGSR